MGAFTVGSISVWWLEPRLLDPGWIGGRIEAMGAAAPVVFVLLQVIQVVLAPIPGQLLAGVGGYLFGSVFGTLYSILGITIGGSVVFLLSRRFGRPFVSRILTRKTLSRIDGFVADYGSAGLFLAFLLPAFPDDALCLLAGLTELRFRRFLVLLLVGRTPTFLAASFAGGALANGHIGQMVIALVALMAVLAAVYHYSGSHWPLSD